MSQPESCLLFGATGLIGGEVLRIAQEEGAIQIECVTREKLYAPLDTAASAATCAIYCIGTTRKKAGSRIRFENQEMDAINAALRICKARQVRRFILVSSQGAHPKSFNHYLRVKGQIEALALDHHFESVAILRPSLLVGLRQEKRFGEAWAIRIAQMASPLFDWAPVQGALLFLKPMPATLLARVALHLTTTPALPVVQVLENTQIHLILNDERS